MFQQIDTLLSPKCPKKDIIGSVLRALNIIELLASHPYGLNAKEVSWELKLNLGTCYHLLNTLQYANYLVKDPDTNLFRLNSKIEYVMLGRVSLGQLVKQLESHVKDLQELTRETAYLSIWDGKEITVSARIEAPHTICVKTLDIGYTGANHASALGKPILSHLNENQFDQYFESRDLPAYTSNTITDPRILREKLVRVKQQGYSLDREEHAMEVFCIGAPIFGARGNVAASLAISLPLSRSRSDNLELVEKVKQTADSASRTLKLLSYMSPALSIENEQHH